MNLHAIEQSLTHEFRAGADRPAKEEGEAPPGQGHAEEGRVRARPVTVRRSCVCGGVRRRVAGYLYAIDAARTTPERELSSELHYSGVSRRGLFSKAIRLGLYTCILYVCIYIRIYISIRIPSMSIR